MVFGSAAGEVEVGSSGCDIWGRLVGKTGNNYLITFLLYQDLKEGEMKAGPEQ